jgi:hypothetical protein
MRSGRFLLQCWLVLAALAAAAPARAQNVPLEYRVKAAYLFNFAKFVEWPAPTPPSRPFTLCIARPDPFGGVLADIVRGESINGRPIVTRTIAAPDTGCDVVFVPRGAQPAPYRRAARTAPMLTVGDDPHFLDQGGIVQFVIDNNSVRFDISPDAAARAGLQISSRLMRVARLPAVGRTP